MEENEEEYENDLSNINISQKVEKKDDTLRKAYYSKLKELYNEFMKTGTLPQLIKKKPPKRSPLYKKKNRQKVIDHDHLLENDNFVGVCHSYCNLNRQPRRFFIPVFFHNGSNYDFRLLLR